MSIVSVAYGAGLAVITVANPPVNTIDAKVRACQEQPLRAFPMYRRARRTMWLPWFLRRWVLWSGIHLSGRFLAENVGIFALT